ncbi:MAG: hypothetical protein COB77_00020 [Gammaproteobacteria bacterium]|nr:MAG: hypothetical protein COB77_00020 [Gammaproteobacteria bacterium]
MSDRTGRNDPCPCGSGKKYKKCCMSESDTEAPATWTDGENVRVLVAGDKPTQVEMDTMTKEYQKQIKSSPFWAELVKQYGEEKAEEILSEFKAEIK